MDICFQFFEYMPRSRISIESLVDKAKNFHFKAKSSHGERTKGSEPGVLFYVGSIRLKFFALGLTEHCAASHRNQQKSKSLWSGRIRNSTNASI